jgi:hypothetical protein
MESIATLVEQKVSRPQIANMFGITVNEVWQEIEKPGSVIGRPGYVHPSDRQREEQRMDELAEMDDFLPLAAASAKARIDRQERAAEREGHGQALRDGQSNRSARSLVVSTGTGSRPSGSLRSRRPGPAAAGGGRVVGAVAVGLLNCSC